MRRRGAAALSCAAVLAVAGCGEDQQFIDDYNEAMKPLEELGNDSAATRPEGGGAARELDRRVAETKKVNDELARLEAPDDARADFDRLRRALRKSEGNLRELAQATEEDDIVELTRASQALARDSQEIDRAEDAVKRKVED